MNVSRILCIQGAPALLEYAAAWFHQKWGVPQEAYRESMEESLTATAVPQWYVCMDGDRIVGGLGLIANDFHNRPDLTPNVCAVFVEPDCRKQGVAGRLLARVAQDAHDHGADTLYLLTDHAAFYERYGWSFLCLVQGDDEPTMSRMYVHHFVEE